MARPGALQFLKSGKLLTGAVFPRFVATWNWLVGAFDSMKGDGDLNPQQGFITIDRSNPDTPIIRFDSLKLPKQSGGGGGTAVPGPYEPVFVNGVLDSVGAGLWPYGREFTSGISIDAGAKVATGFIGLEITHASGSSLASAKVIKISDSYAYPDNIQNTSLDKTVVPLYTIHNGAMSMDLRCLMALAIRE